MTLGGECRTARRAFQKRDFFTCSVCFYLHQDAQGAPMCKLHGDAIR